MASSESHFIHRFKFDFELEDRKTANQTQDELGRIFQSKLQWILQEHLDEFQVDGHLLRVKSLELDLGDLSEAHLESDLIDRFRAVLREKLGEIRAKAAYPSSYYRNVELIPLWPAKLEVLTYFLEFGRLPVSASRFPQSVDEILKDLIKEIPLEVRKRFKELFRKHNYVSLRLVEQFSDEVIEKLFRVFNDSYYVFIQREYKALVERIYQAYGLNKTKIKKILIEASLVYLIKTGNRPFSRVSFFKMVRHFAERRTNQDLSLAFPERGTGNDEKSDLDLRYASLIRLVQKAVAGELSSDQKSALVDAFDVLIRFHFEALANIFQVKKNERSVFLNMIKFLPTDSIQRYIQLASPSKGRELLRIAVRAIAAHSRYLKGTASDTLFRDHTYTSLFQYVSSTPSKSQSGHSFSEFLKESLGDEKEIPEEMLENWASILGREIEAPLDKSKIEEDKEEFPTEKEDLEKKYEDEPELAEEIELEGIAGDSERTRIDFVLHIFETGEVPWWSKNLIEADPIRVFASLIEEGSDLFMVEFQRKVTEATVAERALIAIRLLKMFGHAGAQKILKQVVPDIFGLYVTVSILIGRYRNAVDLPIINESLRDPVTFSWHPIVRFFLDHIEELPDPAELTRYVIKMLAASSGKEVSEVIRGFSKVVSDAMQVGEMRFLPFQTLLPGVEEDLILGSSEAEASIRLEKEAALEKKDEVEQVLSEEIELESVTGDGEQTRIDFVLYILETGEVPRWSKNLIDADPIRVFTSLIEEGSDLFMVEFQRKVTEATVAERALIAIRLLKMFGHAGAQKILKQAVPDIFGLYVTVSILIGRYRDAADLSITNERFRDPTAFDWHPIVRFFLDHIEELPDPAELMRYVIKILAASSGKEVSEVIRGFSKVVSDAMRVGEIRFLPFQTLLPDVEEDFILGSLEAEASIRLEKEAVETLLTEVDDEVDLPGDLEREELPGVSPDKDELAIEEFSEARDFREDRVDEEEGEDRIDEVEDEDRVGEKEGEDQVGEEEDEDQVGEKEGEDQVGEEEDEDQVGTMEEIEAEIQQIREDPEITPEDVVIYYLRTGSLPTKSGTLSESAIWIMIQEQILANPEQIVQVLKEQARSSALAKRIANLPASVFESIIRHLLPKSEEEQFLRFFRGIKKLFSSGSSPVKPVEIGIHAYTYLGSRGYKLRRLEEYIFDLVDFLEKLVQLPKFKIIDWILDANRYTPTSISVTLEEILLSSKGELEPPIDLVSEDEQDYLEVDDHELPSPVEDVVEEEEIYIKNAGLILFVPMLSRAFKNLEFLDVQGKFRSDQLKERAIYFLAYLSHKDEEALEADLVLNKLMTGWELTTPIQADITLTDKEKEIAEGMIDEMRSKWTGMENTKNDSMRTSWYQRVGRLSADKYSTWVLRVDQKAYDLLLSRLAYSIPFFEASWTSVTIRVEWQ